MISLIVDPYISIYITYHPTHIFEVFHIYIDVFFKYMPFLKE